MIHAKNIGRFWAEAIKRAIDMINRLPQSKLRFVSHYEKPTINHFRIFNPCVLWLLAKPLTK